MKRFFALLLLVPTPAGADTDISVYGDVDGHVQTDGGRATTTDDFSAANIELFANGRQGRWSYLAEINFEANEFNLFEFDVERMGVGYVHADWLRVFVGRFPTAIGWYNDAVNHGAIFQLPATRATMVRFEDEGGLAPSHSVGIHADGRFPIGDDHVRYDLELANGRAGVIDSVQNEHDENRSKSVDARLRYEPGGDLEGLVAGVSVYFDSIPAPSEMALATVPVSAPLHEWIFGAHAAYTEHGYHLVSEALLVRHAEIGTGVVRDTYGAFVEAGRAFDKVMPFARVERVRYPDGGDPYYEKERGDSFFAYAVGARHATNDNIALKVQGTASKSDQAGSSIAYSLTGQIAFGF